MQRTLHAQSGALFAFDGGVGKNWAILALVASARARGARRRPVILAPPDDCRGEPPARRLRQLEHEK